MKKTILSLSLLLAVLIVSAQEEKVAIKTSAICEMCQYTIEKDMAFEKGVKSAELDLDTKILHVAYHPRKTSPDKIRKRITLIGYDADSLQRDEEAHKKLPFCCQSDDQRVPLVQHKEGDE